MKCPKCGYLKKAQDNQFVPENECPSCGVVFGKIKRDESIHKFDSPSSKLLNNPSPVSAASLKKARERVDKRLREQLKAQYRDSRHIQTLRLARRLSAEGVRKRQEEWEKQTREVTQRSAQKESHMNTQTNEQAANLHLVEAQKPDSEQHKPSGAIAMALKKKRKEPGSPSEKQPQPSQTTHTPEKEAPATKAAETPSSPRQPIRLFRNKPIGVEENNQKPPTLKEMLKDFDPPETIQPVLEQPSSRSFEWGGGRFTRLLPMVAWMILGVGVIGAILSWTTVANAQPGTHAGVIAGSSAVPVGLLIGFAYLATGVLGFAFFWVSSLISGQLKDIQRLLVVQSQPQAEADEKQAIKTV